MPNCFEKYCLVFFKNYMSKGILSNPRRNELGGSLVRGVFPESLIRNTTCIPGDANRLKKFSRMAILRIRA